MNNKGEFLIICVLENMTLDENTIHSAWGWTITNNFQYVQNLIPNIEVLFIEIGRISFKRLENKTLAFKIISAENKLDKIPFILPRINLEINALLSQLWLLKDNSISCIFQHLQEYSTFISWTNKGNNLCSNSMGEYSSTFLNNEEFVEFVNKFTIDNFEKLFSCRDSASSDNVDLSNDHFVKSTLEGHYPNLSRIQRAFQILSMARSTDFLPMKIGLYINTLECLLLKTETELNFRLQLHTACLLGANAEECNQIMVKVKEGYGVRSKFFHGESINTKSMQKLKEISSNLDDILRASFFKVLENDEQINDNSKIDGFFKSLYFK